MKAVLVCENCSTQLQSGQKFCGICGAFIHTGVKNDFTVECETHQDRPAIGVCVVCSRPVCSECMVKSAGKILCTDAEHGIVLLEWCVLYQPDSEFEAEALVRNLADSGIETKAFSLHDHAAAHWLDDNRVVLFVRKSEEKKAKELLKELNLIDIDFGR